jgi:hypothetical protein
LLGFRNAFRVDELGFGSRRSDRKWLRNTRLRFWVDDDVLNEDWIQKKRMVRSHRLLSLYLGTADVGNALGWIGIAGDK